MIVFEKTVIGYNQELFEIPGLELKQGHVYVLVGANGSGKSTFLKTLIKEQKVLGGKISVDNKSIEDYLRNELVFKMAFVESRFDGVDFLKVHEYVGLGRSPYTSFLGKLKLEDLEIVERSLDLLNLKRLQNNFTNQLSDGEKQLCAISRALAQNTPVIVLDEPTAFLDYGNRKILIDMLKRIALEEKKCIVFSSHDIDLCIEALLEMLIINKSSKKLDYFSEAPSKKVIGEIGFNL